MRCLLYFFVGHLTLIIGFVTSGHAQSQPGSLANGIIPNVTPPSSEAASLAKYGDYQVSYYTGLPQISIPLYTIQSGSLSVPVQISYHAGGVKIDDVESWVGVNWSLNAGGVISRTIVGLEDESVAGGFLYRNQHNLGLQANYSFTLKEDYAFMRQVQDNLVDTEPDIYHFNFGQYSGKFFFDETGKFQTVPANALKLLRCPINNTLDFNVGYWEIADPSGNRYLFGSANGEGVEKTRISQTPGIANKITAWYLKRIISANSSDTIEFNYADKSERYDLPYTHSYRKLEAPTGFPMTSALNEHIVLRNGSTSPSDPNIFSAQGKSMLSEIVWKDGKLSVTANVSRADMQGVMLTSLALYNEGNVKIKGFDFKYGYVNKRYFLDTLVESGKDESKLLKHAFEYNNRQSLPVRMSDIANPGISYAQDHWGYYNGKNSNTSLIPTVSYFPTYVNNNRECDETYMKYGSLKRINYPTGGYTDFEFEANRFIPQSTPGGASYIIAGKSVTAGAADPQPVNMQKIKSFEVPFEQINSSILMQFRNYNKPPSAEAGWLPTVKLERLEGSNYVEVYAWDAFQNFPSPAPSPNQNNLIDFNLQTPLVLTAGQYRLVTDLVCGRFSCGNPPIYPSVTAQVSYSAYDTVNTPGAESSIIGGLRIKNITSYTQQGIRASGTAYEYTIGKALSFPKYLNKYSLDVLHQRTCWPECAVNCDWLEGKFLELTSSSQTIIGFTQGCTVGYDSVTEMQIDNNGVANGKILYTYSFVPDKLNEYNANQSWPYPIMNPAMPSDSYEYKRGLLLSKKIYSRSDNGNYILLNSMENNYEFNDSVTSNRYKAFKALRIKRLKFIDWPCGELYQGYIIPPNNATINDFSYTFYNLVTSWVQLKSTVEKSYTVYGVGPIVQTTTYDYNNSVHLQPTNVIVANSKQQVIKTVNKYPHDFAGTAVYDSMIVRNNISPIVERVTYQNDIKEISRSKINYGFWNGTRTIAPLNEYTSVNGNALYKTNNYDNYDLNGNLVQYTGADGIVTSLVMGYKYGKLVAKVSGANYTAVTQKINISTLQGLTGSSLRTELNKLRTIPSSQTVSMTFDPLIGISSYTDLNGRSVFYDYDVLGRTSVIKDNELNVLKTFDYQYQIPFNQ